MFYMTFDRFSIIFTWFSFFLWLVAFGLSCDISNVWW